MASLVRIGGWFGFTPNSLRVAIARLVSEGEVESDERGSYRTSAAAAPVVTHVEGWRLGERRRRPWSGEWLAASLPRAPSRTERRRSLRALDLLGLREGLAGLWVRPDNIAAPLAATDEKLRSFGLEPGAEVFLIREPSARLASRWSRSLWPVGELERRWRRAAAALETSAAKVASMPVEHAAVETFLVGGDAIRVLATDPLLPDELVDGRPRAALTEAMLDYDALGRRVWARLLDEVRIGAAPAHLAVAS